MYRLTPEGLSHMALGATLLGAGGGGDPYISLLMVQEAMAQYGEVNIVSASELDPDDLVLTVAVIGAPTVMTEKVPSGTEFVGSLPLTFLGSQVLRGSPS